MQIFSAALCVAITLFTLLLPAHLEAKATPPVIVVFDIENKGATLSAQELESMTDYLGNQLGEGGHLRIVPRSEIRERVRAGKRASYKDCYDQKCQIEIGRELAAQMTVATRIGKVGRSCIITAALYDLKTAASARTTTAKAACTADALLEALATVAKALRSTEEASTSAPSGAQSAPTRIVERRIVERRISGFSSDMNAPLMAVGGSMFYGGVLIGAIHAGISASNWRPPGEKKDTSAVRSAGVRLMLPLLRVSF
ncbi:MAG: hypothetical protein JRH20_09235 [Deltaproteobacteria bacterium]|nr:hypothetical protein [Deltaproteobacteria bacterium]